jgi:hypothetical protein
VSFLAPLFLAAVAGVSLPILFHLIRRTTREKTVFSSLMFLQPTPPRITRRSRLEHLILLLLRCVVLCLLALGFARPFLRQPVADDRPQGPGRRVLILVDTSASMRREGVWSQATAKAAGVLGSLGPADQAAVWTFDRQIHSLITFEQWSALGVAERPATASQRLNKAAPGWAATHLGNALVNAAAALDEAQTQARDEAFKGPRQIVLISDLQEGGHLDSLPSFQWPKGIELIVEPIAGKRTSNAGLQLLVDSEEARKEADPAVRVRVTNSSDSRREQFKIGWARAEGGGFLGAPVELYVPPGQSRVLVAPSPPSGLPAEHLVLEGDEETFDNRVHLVPVEPARANVLFLSGGSGQDNQDLLFYVQRAFQETRRQVVQVVSRSASAPILPGETDRVALVIANDSLPTDRVGGVRRLVEEGRHLVFVLKSTQGAAVLARLLNVDSIAAQEAPGTRDALLGEIDFQHPLFAPFAEPRYADFTKVHYWKHRRLDISGIAAARAIARFDDGDPAVIEVPMGKGLVLILTSGWHPGDSQLALSTKFVPLLYTMLERAGGGAARINQYMVGDEVAPPRGAGTGSLQVRKPDGSQVTLTNQQAFVETDLPGIYLFGSAGEQGRFAVNLDGSESRTAPLSVDDLEKLGVPVKPVTGSAAQAAAQKRHLLEAELENRQKLWRWLLVGALVVLLLETWVAGWFARRAVTPAETAT